MWSRKELKTTAKAAVRKNYWRAVLVAIILGIVVGNAGSIGNVSKITFVKQLNSQENTDDTMYMNSDGEWVEGSTGIELPEVFQDPSDETIASTVMLGVFLFVGVLVVLLLWILLHAFLLNPIEVGCQRFFHRNLSRKAEFKELAFSFDHSYKNVAFTMFLRDVYTIFWTILLIVPGIVKRYEYRMIPYLLSEYPDMPRADAFAISKSMMMGNKWKAFLLDLSFLLWNLLSICTVGIVGIFWVFPYQSQTDAALYEVLKEGKKPFGQTGQNPVSDVALSMDNTDTRGMI